MMGRREPLVNNMSAKPGTERHRQMLEEERRAYNFDYGTLRVWKFVAEDGEWFEAIAPRLKGAVRVLEAERPGMRFKSRGFALMPFRARPAEPLKDDRETVAPKRRKG